MKKRPLNTLEDSPKLPGASQEVLPFVDDTSISDNAADLEVGTRLASEKNIEKWEKRCQLNQIKHLKPEQPAEWES